MKITILRGDSILDAASCTSVKDSVPTSYPIFWQQCHLNPILVVDQEPEGIGGRREVEEANIQNGWQLRNEG